jgi:hypothetical protein
MSRPHIRGPGYSGSAGAPGYEVPYASNYDPENRFFTGPGEEASAGSEWGGEVFAGGIWDALGPHGPSTPFGINVPSLLKHGGISDHDERGGRRGGDGRGDDSFPWTTFAWASLAVVGAGVIVYAATRGRTS